MHRLKPVFLMITFLSSIVFFALIPSSGIPQTAPAVLAQSDSCDPQTDYTDIGIMAYEEGAWLEALSYFNCAIFLNDLHLDAYNYRGATYIQLLDEESAIADFLYVLSFATEESWYPNWANTYLGIAYFYLNEDELALEALNNALGLDPENILARRYRGLVYQYQGDDAAAIADFSQVITQDPSDSLAYTLRALSYQYQGDDVAALQDSQTAAALNPENALALRTQALSFLYQEKDDAVFEVINKAIDLNPNDPSLYFVRGQAYLATGQDGYAITDFTAYTQNPPAPDVLNSVYEAPDLLNEATLLKGVSYLFQQEWEIARENLTLVANTDTPESGLALYMLGALVTYTEAADTQGESEVSQDAQAYFEAAQERGFTPDLDINDLDGDAVFFVADNCPFDFNPDQTDSDNNGQGDACQDDTIPDLDGDGLMNFYDECPETFGPLPRGCPIENTDGGPALEVTPLPTPTRVPTRTPRPTLAPSPTFTPTATRIPDGDGDGIPDARDNCIGTTNVGQNDADGDGAGDVCDPDDDNDGVADGQDACPTVVGGSNRDVQGCPDADSDGFSNGGDACPNNAGTSAIDRVGCPDDDFDGYSNQGDSCPSESGGSVKNGVIGCPDDDSDGYANSIDFCPLEFGTSTVNWYGCPDGDGDGWKDTEDSCPTEFGTSGRDGIVGCVDSDGDGWADSIDNCATDFGTSVLGQSGCPDDDGDGWSNGTDLCPGQMGPNNGCAFNPDDEIAPYKESFGFAKMFFQRNSRDARTESRELSRTSTRGIDRYSPLIRQDAASRGPSRRGSR